MNRVEAKLARAGVALLLLGGTAAGWAAAEQEAQKSYLLEKTNNLELYVTCNPQDQKFPDTSDPNFTNSSTRSYPSGDQEKLPAVVVKASDWNRNEVYDVKTFKETGTAKNVDIRIRQTLLGNYNILVVRTISQYNSDYVDYLRKQGDEIELFRQMIRTDFNNFDREITFVDAIESTAFCPTRIPTELTRPFISVAQGNSWFVPANFK